jgi:acetylornithine deacetylase/succinyl-diaminopimelate desuccinylase-like protein
VQNRDDIEAAVAASATRSIELWEEALSLPSVSAEGKDLAETADWLEGALKSLGATTSRIRVPGSPDAVVGRISSGSRRLMIYDHYDVQPVDPIELWETPPFQPSHRDGKMFARGAADNKGDLIARLCAVGIYQELFGDFPYEIKFFVEGEEEIGSPHFDQICIENAELVAADDCVWEGGWFDPDDHPTMYYGCKGLLYLEFRVRSLNSDQHSSNAVMAPSAPWRLTEALASLKNPDGSFAIEGFLDDIATPNQRASELIDNYQMNEEALKEIFGISEFKDGRSGVELRREIFLSPTANIAGLRSGYTVPGSSKTVLPAEASAKMDLRLVPDQDPDDIFAKLRKHLDSRGFTDIEIESLAKQHPSRSPMDSLLGQAVEETAEDWFSPPTSVLPWMWATGPMHAIREVLGIPITSPPGVGRPDSQIHAPNENARVTDFLSIIGFTVGYLKAYGDRLSKEPH